jgi:cell division septum initiation protein DivIVA
MEAEQRIKELEERIKSLEKIVKTHDDELIIISDFMHRSGDDKHPSLFDLIEEAKKRGWFE